jgi:hypothetical protein
MRKMRRIKKQKPVLRGPNRQYDFMKNWRTIRYFYKRKYGLSESELEIVLYLYNEPPFSREDFLLASNTMHWKMDRFYDLRERGFIVVWREKNEVENRKALYDLSFKSKKICSSIYKKLLGEEKVSESPYNNPIMRGDTYMDKVYRMAIRKMNESKK